MRNADHPSPEGPISRVAAQEVARLMGALSTASRVRILALLRAEPCSVGDLGDALDMEQPAVSHQLRVLRDLGLVVGDRRGRQVIYGLSDARVAALVDEARRMAQVAGEGPVLGRSEGEPRTHAGPEALTTGGVPVASTS